MISAARASRHVKLQKDKFHNTTINQIMYIKRTITDTNAN